MSNSVKKCEIRAIMAYKVIQGHWGRYQSKPVCDFMLVINSNWHPISYRFGVIAAYCSNFGHCVSAPPPWRGLETPYDVYLGLFVNRVVNLLLVLIELFSLGVTAEELRAIIGENRRFRSNRRQLTHNFR